MQIKVLAFAVAFGITSMSAQANIQSQMDAMFNTMANTTSPGAFETATRGVISGGSMRIRNKISNAPIVSFRPPSFQAGCGGIDMFAGSFSFINAQQFVQALRSIASNAVGVASGYAFKLALQAMGPTVANVIKELQEAMQMINSLMANSCQLATGLVTDTFSAFGATLDGQSKQKSYTKGIADNFSSWFSTTGKSAAEVVADNGFAEKCKDQGNVVWCEMTKRNMQSFFSYGSRQTDEIIMSMTGTIIMGKLVDTEDGKGKRPETRVLPPMGIDLETMIEGRRGEKIKIYDCSFDTVACTPEPGDAMSVQEIEFDGLAAKIVKAFRGDGASPGIIKKWATNTGVFTNDEAAIIAGLQETSFSSMIQRLSQRSEAMAAGFVSTYSKLLAREVTYSLARSYLDAVKVAVTGSEMEAALGAKPKDFLAEAYNTLNFQYDAALTKYGNDSQMHADYKQKMEIMPPTNFISALGPKTVPVGGE